MVVLVGKEWNTRILLSRAGLKEARKKRRKDKVEDAMEGKEKKKVY